MKLKSLGTLGIGVFGLLAYSALQAQTCDALAKRVRSTSVSVGGDVPASDEYTPVVVAPAQDGTSVLAWRDNATAKIKLAKLTSADKLNASLPSLSGLEVHAALATSSGTALAVVDNDPDIYTSAYCQSAATPDNAVCGKMDLVRLDTSGNLMSRTTLTNKTNVNTEGAKFVWWYGHTARLATDGSKIGVYFRSAGSYWRDGSTTEVDIHAGDTLKFVDSSTGALLSGGWDWGCSHSWSVRLAYNGSMWGAACHGDAYPDALQVARLTSPTATPNDVQWLNDTDPSQRAIGGLVPNGASFWTSYFEPSGSSLVMRVASVPGISGGTALKSRKTVSGATGIDNSYPFRPYMAAYGTGKMLLGWKSSGKLVLAVASTSTGAVVEGPVTTSLPIDNFEDMVAAPNGDVVWAHSAGGSAVTVNRVASCTLGS